MDTHGAASEEAATAAGRHGRVGRAWRWEKSSGLGVESGSGRARCHTRVEQLMGEALIAEVGRNPNLGAVGGESCFDVSRMRRSLIDIQVQRTSGRQLGQQGHFGVVCA